MSGTLVAVSRFRVGTDNVAELISRVVALRGVQMRGQ